MCKFAINSDWVKITGLLTLILLASVQSLAQEKKALRITPYTIQSTFEKLKKEYPFISPVSPEYNEGINSREDEVYRTLGARQLKVDVYHPNEKADQPFPAVLLIHGGGWVSGSKENLRPMAQRLAQEGFVAVVIEYRLSREAPYPAAVIDIKAALDWMRKNASKFNLDKDEIAVLGASAGAQ